MCIGGMSVSWTIHVHCLAYCMKPLAKKEGNSRQRRLGRPFSSLSSSRLASDVVWMVSWEWGGGGGGGVWGLTGSEVNAVAPLTAFCFSASMNLSTSSIEVLCSVHVCIR